MAYATVSNRRLRAEGSNPDVPVSKFHRGSGSSDELVEEMVIDSAAPSWGQNIQKMMICMMGKIDRFADDIMEVKTLANNAKSEAAEASTAVNLLRVEVDTIKKSINELQGRRPSGGEQNYEKSRTRQCSRTLCTTSRTTVSSPTERNSRRWVQHASKRRRRCGSTCRTTARASA